MKKGILAGVLLALVWVSLAHAASLDDFLKVLTLPGRSGSDDGATISALKEALSIGTENAVGYVSKANGYFGNPTIKILLPERLRTIGNTLEKIGYGKQVDAFVLSMNRAAENAAPKAKKVFVDAVKQMTFEDAGKILHGGETAATDFFKGKTADAIAVVLKPAVSASMNKVGAVRAYKEMTEKYLALASLAGADSLDLDQYVTDRTVDGLFYMLSQEEKKIRTDPAARVTELLRTVFGK